MEGWELSTFFSSLSYTSVYSSHSFHVRLTSSFLSTYNIFQNLVAISDSPDTTNNKLCNTGEVICSFGALVSSDNLRNKTILPSKVAYLEIAENCNTR